MTTESILVSKKYPTRLESDDQPPQQPTVGHNQPPFSGMGRSTPAGLPAQEQNPDRHLPPEAGRGAAGQELPHLLQRAQPGELVHRFMFWEMFLISNFSVVLSEIFQLCIISDKNLVTS